MSKRYLRRVWRRLKPINTWYFFAAFIVFLVIGIFAVRQNNITSLRLRDEVLKADEQNGDVEGGLQRLRAHMHAHMNAGLSSGSLQQPIQLKYTYERLLAEKQKQSAGSQSLYEEAQEYCERQFAGASLRDGRVPCVQQYISERGGQAEIPVVPDALYKFDFVSPGWSPDLAGWSLLLAGVALALFAIRFLTERWFHAELDQHL